MVVAPLIGTIDLQQGYGRITMFPLSKNICTLVVATVALTTASLAAPGDAFAFEPRGPFGNIGSKGGPGPLINTNKISGGIDKLLNAGGKVIDKTVDVGGKVIDKAINIRGKVIDQNLAAQREREAQLAAQREREARLAALRERETRHPAMRCAKNSDPLSKLCVLVPNRPADTAQQERDRAQAEAERAAARAAAAARRPKVIYVGSPASVAPAPIAAPAPAPACLTKEYLQAGTVLFRDVCTNQFAMNSTTLPSQVVTAATRACLTKENLQAGVVLFKDICTNEWALNPPEQQAQAPQTSPVPQVR
jgi:hypothetical protein